MPNKPKAAKEKRAEPVRRHNAQDDHEGGAHSPDEFNAMDPDKQGADAAKPDRPPAPPRQKP